MLQHLSARLAKALRVVFEGLARRPLRCWAEPVAVQRFADYRAERGNALTAWQPLAAGSARARAHVVLDGRHVFELLDCFFGGEGEAPQPLPAEFTPAAETLVARIGQAIVAPLDSAWEPVARIAFRAIEGHAGNVPEAGGDEPVVVTRFGVAQGEQKPVWVDIVYPVSALKPHAASLTAKVHDSSTDVEPAWRSGLTRAVMGVTFPVRSVLAEPVVSLGRLLDLKAGDVIPIEFGPEVPVMVAQRRLGTGLVGTANGRAAVRLTSLEPLDAEDLK
ncbi:flagellar motor switch protein FliM [Sphingomonas canadensis]|uniref:Flagellar motor switch protein FliM n=1 Tax=Sphingomonas canadensis TaxID=1219257 RepID=A0ABW3H4K8_9SPHN|nr:flagellar motor switch protein FliM [Sphingomonas canadensis]MCW3834820.1 flagellar motor switch protein FliM [Sphingomonas canadensis]